MPYSKMPHRQERLELYRLMFDLTRLFNTGIFGPDAPMSPESIFVTCCVGIGHAENRPMSATKLAHYLNMPRTTVLRKLDELIEVGVVERAGRYYYLSPSRLRRSTASLMRAKQMILSACDALQRNDTVHFGQCTTSDRPNRTH